MYLKGVKKEEGNVASIEEEYQRLKKKTFEKKNEKVDKGKQGT